MRSPFLHSCLAVLFSLALVSPLYAQRRPPPKPLPAGETPANSRILVDVYTDSGSAVESRPSVVLTTGGLEGPVIGRAARISPQEWEFRGLEAGTEYVIRITAKGFQTQHYYVTIPPYNNAVVHVRIYLVPNGRPEKPFPPPPGRFLLSPRAQHEVQQATKDLKSRKFSAARRELKKALQSNPRHPGVNYLMGLSYLREGQFGRAIPYLEKSLAIDPTNKPALLALGIARYQQADYARAIAVLNKLIAAAPASWQAEWILACSYLRERNYAQARRYAEQAIALGRKEASPVQLVLAEALSALGERQKAIQAFEVFLKEDPHNPDAAPARAKLAQLRKAASPLSPRIRVQKTSATDDREMPRSPAPGAKPASQPAAPAILAPPAPVAPTPALLPPAHWAPPDVDAIRPPLISSRACPLPSLLRQAERDAVQWVKDLQEFTATEEYESVEIGHHGKIGQPFEKRFSYLVFVHKPRPYILAIEELRQPHRDLNQMGAPIVAIGAPGLALVFHPNFVHEYRWSCDGLGSWKGEPAWVVRFAQRTDRPTTTLQSFDDARGAHLLPLKGLVWLSKNGDHVMHLESDLLKPLPAIHLERQHFAIDYRLVAFHSHPVKLWLPDRVDFYVLYRGHAYHNYSRYSHFQLFWTGVGQMLQGAGHQPPR